MLTLLALPALAQEAPAAAVIAPPEPPPADTVSMRISLVPGFGVGAAGDAHVDGVSVGLVSRAASLRGVDAEALLSWVDGPVDGLQLSSGLAWARGDVRMGQGAALMSVAEGDVRGVQGSGFANVAGGEVDGLQGAGALNVAVGGGRGVQASGGLNVAGDLRGVQAAPLNLARSVDGLQVGLVNVGRDVRGVQLGLVNVAKTSQVSIAPINLIGDGLHRLDVWTSESSVGNVGLKFGSRYVYTLVGAGLVAGDQPWFTWGGGLGVHLPVGPVWAEVDGTAWGLSQGQVVAPGVHGKARVQVGVDLLRHVAPFVGLSMNTWSGNGQVWPRAVGLPSSTHGDRRFVGWPGLHAGISLF